MQKLPISQWLRDELNKLVQGIAKKYGIKVILQGQNNGYAFVRCGLADDAMPMDRAVLEQRCTDALAPLRQEKIFPVIVDTQDPAQWEPRFKRYAWTDNKGDARNGFLHLARPHALFVTGEKDAVRIVATGEPIPKSMERTLLERLATFIANEGKETPQAKVARLYKEQQAAAK